METSIDQAKSIIDLLQGMSWAATPIFISMIFPVLYFSWKKILLATSKPERAQREEEFLEKTGSEGEEEVEVKKDEEVIRIEKFSEARNAVFSVPSNRLDLVVFYSCIGMFILGVFTLKIGESKHENIRQDALQLKKYFEENTLVRSNLPKVSYFTQLSFDRIERIVDYHPDYYSIHFDSAFSDQHKKGTHVDTVICVVDSGFRNRYFSLMSPLFESFLRTILDSKDSVCIGRGIMFNQGNYLQHLFHTEFVYRYLSLHHLEYDLSVHSDSVFIFRREGRKAIKGSDPKGKKFQL